MMLQHCPSRSHRQRATRSAAGGWKAGGRWPPFGHNTTFYASGSTDLQTALYRTMSLATNSSYTCAVALNRAEGSGECSAWNSARQTEGESSNGTEQTGQTTVARRATRQRASCRDSDFPSLWRTRWQQYRNAVLYGTTFPSNVHHPGGIPPDR